MRETFGAAIALYRAMHAADGEVRDVMSTIAEEECGHAELAWDVGRWASEALDETARGRIDVATAAAIDELKRGCADDGPSSLRTIAGLPSAATARAMIDGLERELWHRA